MEHLDRYEREGIDDQFIDDVTEEERFAARLAAERELADRDVLEGRLTGRRRGLPAALEGAYLVGAVCVAGPRCCSLYRGAGWRTVEGTCRPPTVCGKNCGNAAVLQRSLTRMCGDRGAGGGWRRRRRAWMRTRIW